MKKLLILALLFFGYNLQAQDLTGTWEGEFIIGTTGLRQPAKMVLEIVQVEGKLYGIFDLYPIDTRKNDRPNITYTFEGKCKPETVRYALIQGRVVEGNNPFEVVQFIFERRGSDSVLTLVGKWFKHLEPLNSREKGSGTFTVKRTTSTVSDRLLLPRQEKEILEKLDKQNTNGK